VELFKDPLGYRKWYETNKVIYENEKRVIEELRLSDCLDIGSGPSIFHEVIKGELISLDISFDMLLFAKSEEDRVQGDALNLPFRDNSIKCSFISVTICFISDVKKLIEEVYRVTREFLVVCIVAKDSSWGKFYEELGRKGHRYYSKANFITKAELKELLMGKFNILEVYSTLTFSPLEEPIIESPRRDEEGAFYCIKAEKINRKS